MLEEKFDWCPVYFHDKRFMSDLGSVGEHMQISLVLNAISSNMK